MRLTWNLARAARVAAAGLAVLMFAATASAQLLNFTNPGHPSLTPNPSFSYPFMELTTKVFDNSHPDVVGSASYDGTRLTIKTHPQWVTFGSAPGWFNASYVAQASDDSTSPCAPVGSSTGFACGSFTINAKIDAKTGQLVGVPTDTDVVFRGHTGLSHFEFFCDNGSQDLVACSLEGVPHPEALFHDEVFDADLNGILLTGRVVGFAANVGGGEGQFQFRIAVTGGLLTNPLGPMDPLQPRWCVQSFGCYARPTDLIQVDPDPLGTHNGFDVGINITSTLTGGFATSDLSGTAKGTAGTIARVAALGCNGIIGDRVWNDLNHNGIQDAGEPGINGAVVTLLHGNDPPKTDTTDASGDYEFGNVCSGPNQVDVAGPQWFTASPSNQGGNPELDSNGSGVVVDLASGDVVRSVDFGFYEQPVISTAYTTFTQSAWGAKPKVGNAAKALADYFDWVYPTGEAIIGIPDTVGRYSITVTGAAPVQTFLPQGGLPWKLDRSYVDPPHINLLKHKGKFKWHFMVGQLAGNVLALRFNVDFSNMGLTRPGLVNLKVKSGLYAGKTVGQILEMANAALAGAPQSSILNYFFLNNVVETINRNFDAGTTNKGFLIQ